jgi:hypothetical protein
MTVSGVPVSGVTKTVSGVAKTVSGVPVCPA